MESGKSNIKVLIGIVLMLFLVIITSAQQGGGVVVGADTGSTATGTTGTTGTTSTTGGTAGNGNGQPVSNYTVLSKIEEKLHAWSRYISGGVLLAPNIDRHVVRLKITCPYTTQITPDATGFWEDHTFIKAVGVPVGTEIGADPNIPSVFLSPYGNAIIPDPPEVCATVFFGNSISNNTPLANWEMNVQRGTQGILTGGQAKYWAYYLVWGKHWNTETLTWDLSRPASNLAGWHSTTLNIDKIDLAPISIDSRKVYGKANLDGELPGDPNAEISNNWFNPWIFRGGHFVGNMPFGSSKDQSGLARTQLQLANELNASNYLAGCVTTFATGMRGTFSAGTIGLYRPALTDSKLTQSQNAIWDTRWTLNPGGTQSGPGDYTTLPYYSVTPTVNDQNNYLNWQMPYANIIWRTEYGGNGVITSTPEMWKHVALCQTDEASSTWQYFGSQWLETVPGQMFPLTDSRPRIWKVR